MAPGEVNVARARREVIDEILRQARSAAPLESCGLLLGSRNEAGEWLLDTAFAARNLLDSPTRFQVDPEDHFRAIRTARERGMAVVGAYHSHPASAAIPSPRDLAEALDADLLYLIAGLPTAEVRAYRLHEGNFRPVELVPL